MRKASIASTTTASAPSRTPSTPMTPTASAGSYNKGEVRTSKSDGVKINVTGDKTRDKCIEIIYDALASDSGARASRATASASAPY